MRSGRPLPAILPLAPTPLLALTLALTLALAGCSQQSLLEDPASEDRTAATTGAPDTSDPPGRSASTTESIPDLVAPQALTATLSDPAGIDLTWSPVEGATGYRIYRDAAPVADVDSPPWRDEDADPPSQPPVDALHVTGTPLGVTLGWTPPASEPGAAHSYTLRATAGPLESPLSDPAEGRRAAWPLAGYEVRSSADTEVTLDASTTQWTDEDAPPPTLSAPLRLEASDATRHEAVDLVAFLPLPEDGETTTWTVTSLWGDADSLRAGASAPAEGSTAAPPELEIVLERQGDTEWEVVVFSEPFVAPWPDEVRWESEDAAAPEDGSVRTYRARAFGDGLEAVSEPAEGRRLPPLPLGATCGAEDICASGFCDADTESCRAPLGGACALREDCASGTFCWRGACEPPGWGDVAPDSRHLCGVRTEGTLWCWGTGSRGRLGLGDEVDHFTPVQVGEADNWSMVAVYDLLNCGVRDDGTLWCWGVGRLGNGSNEELHAPTRIGEAEDWNLVRVGSLFACGLRGEGTLWCWGAGGFGRLGIGNTEERLVPTQVGEDDTWRELSLGRHHACGIREGGSLYCWGDGANGRLGTGDVDAQDEPTRIGDASWLRVSAGFAHTCGVQEGGSLWCWGAGGSGQLGVGDTDGRMAPYRVGDGEDWRDVTATNGHSCGLRSDGSLWCWGQGTDGRLGVGDGGGRLTPAEVAHPAGARWVRMTVKSNKSCAVDENLMLWCWGSEDHSGLGFGVPPGPRTEPTALGAPSEWRMLRAGSGWTCGVAEGGSLWCWGRTASAWSRAGGDPEVFRPDRILSSADWSSVSTANQHACGLQEEGSLWCWGSGEEGALGQGDREDSDEPLPVAPSETWEEVNAAANRTCAVREDGTLWCWGWGDFGGLGQGDEVDRLEPTQVGAGDQWRAVTGGFRHTCGLQEDDSLWCWGDNAAGQLGLGDEVDRRLEPTAVASGMAFESVAAGLLHTCAVTTDGRLFCWGRGGNGRLGSGDTADIFEPQQVGSADTWTEVSTGALHTCGVQEDRSLWCWGSSGGGRLGIDVESNQLVPVEVGEGELWSSVSAGSNHTCALGENGAGYCWGTTSEGQVGDGSGDRYVPARIP